MQEKKNFWSNFANILVRFAILALVGLFLFNIGRSIWKNHSVEEKIDNLKQTIANLENQSINLKNRILYYQTDTYKELEARTHLYYQKSGEKLVILLKQENQNLQDTSQNQSSSSNETKNQDTRPNWQKWINYIFG